MWRWLLAVALFWSARARADAPERLTSRGRFMPGGALGGYWSNNADSPGLTAYRSHAVWLAPSITYFVRDYIGLGTQIGFSSWSDDEGPRTYRSRELSAGGHALGELPLGPQLGLLFMAQLGYTRVWFTFTEADLCGGSPGCAAQQHAARQNLLRAYRDQHRLVLGLYLPLLIHVSSSVAIGVGPTLGWSTDLASSREYDSLRPPSSVPSPVTLRYGFSTFIGCSF